MNDAGREAITHATAMDMAYSCYNERNTLWMHNQGRIKLSVPDILRLSLVVEMQEKAVPSDAVLASNTGVLALQGAELEITPETDKSEDVGNWFLARETVDTLFGKSPSSDPVRGDVKTWGKKEQLQFIEQNMLSAANVWDGRSDAAWDIELRHFTDSRTLDEVITITRLEHVGKGDYSGPIPKRLGPVDFERVLYTITPNGCSATAQSVEVDVKMQTRLRKAAKTTVKEREAFAGNHQVTTEQLSQLLQEIADLTPRRGRVWSNLAR